MSNCNLVHGHGGVVIGSEMSGGVSNVTISNCVFQDTDRGIRVKTRRGRGGAVEQVTANNLVMERVLCPFTFNMYYQCGAEGDAYKEKTAHTADVSTPVFRNIRIAGLQAVEVRAAAGFFYGLPEMPVENIVITDCTVAMAKGGEGGCAAMMEDAVPTQGKGIILRFARNITFRNLTVLECKGAPIDKDDTVENLTIDA